MSLPSIQELREYFRYEPETGFIYLRNPAVNRLDIKTPVGSLNRSRGYVQIQVGRKTVRAQRLAWALHYGEWPTSIIDHEDRDKTNNRIENLRQATKSQNTANCNPRGSTGVKGVYNASGGKPYLAQIKVNYANKYLGKFDLIDEAAHAFNKAAIHYFGEFAVLNPIGKDYA